MDDLSIYVDEANRIVRDELADAFEAIQQPRSDYQLEKFVVFEKDTEPLAYAQCVLEMQVKHQAIRRGVLSRRRLEIEICRLRDSSDPLDEISADEKNIDVESIDQAVLGALREFRCLYRIFKKFQHIYTYNEIQAAQKNYWERRIIRQAQQDMSSIGTVGSANIDALRMVGVKGWDVDETPLYGSVSVFPLNTASQVTTNIPARQEAKQELQQELKL